ncbi:cytochrome bc complex cytochrome b subunit [Nonomuraea sp. SMC257]|uniref:Cytochrome bc1 complex cytochrome b subunit n=1 Tax=Nonomuraea montanisoli TaxID=2741721 RepID=A0A7Y6I4S2_9ACTN|nr:cytochrome b N-terminal domain-containing protein [Nonomuraea montanisoli]NUW31702.1 cytochrome bc complex cytochrome b subunit [Nonomuraea montanisoli]
MAVFRPGAARAARDVAVWLDERLGLARWLRPTLRKLFPGHWSFLLGELALYAFALLVLTGAFLTLFYEPSATGAYPSVRGLSLEIRGGLLVRGLHHWSATVFVLAIVAHLCRVFFTGAFRRPREAAWVLGVVIFGLVLVEAFLGVSLPADRLGFTGLREAQGLLLSVPVAGAYVSRLLFGGDFPGTAVPRLFVAHVLLVPGVLLAAVPLHALVLTWRQGHTERRGGGVTGRQGHTERRGGGVTGRQGDTGRRGEGVTGRESGTRRPGEGASRRQGEGGRREVGVPAAESRVSGGPFFPSFVARNAGTALATAAAIALAATLFPVGAGWAGHHGPYHPGAPPPSAQPFWYAGVLEGALRLAPPWEVTVGSYTLPVGLWIPPLVLGAFFLALLAYPFAERRVTGDRGVHHLLDRPARAPGRTALGVAVLVLLAVLWAGTWVSVIPPDPWSPQPTLVTTEEIYRGIVYGLRAAVFVLPVAAYALTRAWCHRRARRHPESPGEVRTS